MADIWGIPITEEAKERITNQIMNEIGYEWNGEHWVTIECAGSKLL